MPETPLALARTASQYFLARACSPSSSSVAACRSLCRASAGKPVNGSRPLGVGVSA